MSRASGLTNGSGPEPNFEWAGIVLVNPRGELLLNLRDSSKAIGAGQWDLVGGTLEASETPEACILREVFEETGESMRSVEWLQDYDVPLNGGSWGRLHVFFGELDKDASVLLVGEGVEHRFFSPHELEALDIVEGMKGVLLDFVARQRRAKEPSGVDDGLPLPRLPRLAAAMARNDSSGSAAASSGHSSR